MKSNFLIFVLLILTVGCDKAPIKKDKPKEIVISSTVVEAAQIANTVKLVGSLTAAKSIIITTEVDGKVASLNVTDNASVEQGQLILSLASPQARAELNEAKAYLRDETRKLNEYIQLGADGGVSQTVRDSQQASVDIAQARANAAQVNLDYHQILAPFAGILGLTNVTEGQRLVKDEPLMTLDDLSNMQLDLKLPEKYISKLKVGQKLSAKVGAWQDDTFAGVVQAIDSRVQPQSLDITIRVSIANTDNKLKPGMLAHAKLAFPAIEHLVIPLAAVEYSAEQTFVYVVDEQQSAKRVEVMLGEQTAENVVVESGLKLGQRIVVEGLVNLKDNALVQEVAPTQSEETQ